MAITFEEEQQGPVKKIIAAAIVIAVLGGVGFFGYQYFQKQEQALTEVTVKKVEVNWQTLKDSKLNDLDAFQEIAPYQGDLGKENPFN
jgi:hypothetical protein